MGRDRTCPSGCLLRRLSCGVVAVRRASRGEDGGVVFEVAACDFENCLDELLHGFSRMHVSLFDQGADVDVEGVSFQHAVGEEHQAVAWLEPCRERELPGLARVGAGQQAVLDLGNRSRDMVRSDDLGDRLICGRAAVDCARASPIRSRLCLDISAVRSLQSASWRPCRSRSGSCSASRA
jgi:hypothetical protein